MLLELRGVSGTTPFIDDAWDMLDQHREALDALAELLQAEGTVSGERLQGFLDERIE